MKSQGHIRVFESLIVLVNPTKLTINLHNLVIGYSTKNRMQFDSLNEYQPILVFLVSCVEECKLKFGCKWLQDIQTGNKVVHRKQKSYLLCTLTIIGEGKSFCWQIVYACANSTSTFSIPLIEYYCPFRPLNMIVVKMYKHRTCKVLYMKKAYI